jgi:ketosteroid isomerase-like protein
VGEFEGAFNQYDAGKVASFYAADGDRINGNFELARGRVEIAKQYETDFANRRRDTTSWPLRADLSIRLLRSDLALVDGEWDDFESGKKVRRYFTVVMTNNAGRWQIAAGRVRGTKKR